MTSDRDMALAAGGDDFDTKPVRFQQLLEKIERLLAEGSGIDEPAGTRSSSSTTTSPTATRSRAGSR